VSVCADGTHGGLRADLRTVWQDAHRIVIVLRDAGRGGKGVAK
jgi:hypothetical protein